MPDTEDSSELARLSEEANSMKDAKLLDFWLYFPRLWFVQM
jgi:hypothetical protein